jgi:hypothetical protein
MRARYLDPHRVQTALGRANLEVYFVREAYAVVVAGSDSGSVSQNGYTFCSTSCKILIEL